MSLTIRCKHLIPAACFEVSGFACLRQQMTVRIRPGACGHQVPNPNSSTLMLVHAASFSGLDLMAVRAAHSMGLTIRCKHLIPAACFEVSGFACLRQQMTVRIRPGACGHQVPNPNSSTLMLVHAASFSGLDLMAVRAAHSMGLTIRCKHLIPAAWFEVSGFACLRQQMTVRIRPGACGQQVPNPNSSTLMLVHAASFSGLDLMAVRAAHSMGLTIRCKHLIPAACLKSLGSLACDSK